MDFRDRLRLAQEAALKNPDETFIQKPTPESTDAVALWNPAPKYGDVWTPIPPPVNSFDAQYLTYSRIMPLGFDWGYNGPLTPVSPPPPPKPKIPLDKIDALRSVEPRKPSQRVPDGIDPIVGWRAWNVRGGMLTGLAYTKPWEPRKQLEAVCGGNDGEDEKCNRCPSKECNCGVWAFPSIESLNTALAGYADVSVFGEVYLWGRIIECTNGFRAQFAYPKELWLLDSSLEELGYIYNVPVRTIPT